MCRIMQNSAECILCRNLHRWSPSSWSTQPGLSHEVVGCDVAEFYAHTPSQSSRMVLYHQLGAPF